MLEEIKKRFEKKLIKDNLLSKYSYDWLCDFMLETYKLGVEEGKKKVIESLKPVKCKHTTRFQSRGYFKGMVCSDCGKEFKTNLKKL